MPNIIPNTFDKPTVFLSIAGSAQFRELLIAKNLAPYNIDGVYSYQGETSPYQVVLSDFVPIDTPNVSETGIDDASVGMILNKYGPGTKILDGADIISSDGAVSYSQAGQGSIFGGTVESKKEYDQSSANIQLVNEFFIDVNAVVNTYIPEGGYVYSYVSSDNIQPKGAQGGAPYPNFNKVDFGYFNILQGGAFSLFNLESSNFASQDSYLAQLSTQFLAQAFRERVNREIERATIGRVNLQAFTDVFSASLLASGQQDLIAKNYVITVPTGVFDQSAFLLQKFSGTYIPTSPIEGDYFQEQPRRNTTVGQLLQGINNKITKPVTPTNRSQRFLANTGSGQKSVLFNNLGYNIYKPNYDKNLTQIGTVIDQIFDKDNSIGNLYIPGGEDIPAMFAPSGEVPYTPYGEETRTKVYGDDVLSKQFETDDINRRKMGLASLPYGEDSDPTGGFTWKSLQGPQPGALVGPGTNTQPTGEVLGNSPVYTGNVREKLQSSLSTNFEYNESSLLARTQRIVESADLVKGAKRLTHAGNAINQISKIFHDGYKEITKGSRVRKYVNKNGIEVGQEYGRVFTKDTPYLTYQNLQSGVANDNGEPINGNIRKFTNSIIDSTYNLNIAPMAGKESTNIQKTGPGNVKKYMLSIENLAWKGTPEFINLPHCEQGPNGGRIMWFPPYDLRLDSESSSPRFKGNSFLGRPEPIYTYENTERSGGISFKIIVDHPSVANLIVKKELAKANYSDNDVREIMASFFAGLKKYDIYELARKYNTLSPQTINEAYAQVLESNRTSPDDAAQVVQEIGATSNNLPVSNQVQADLENFKNNSFYFQNSSTTGQNYEDVFVAYTQPNVIEQYINAQPLDEIARMPVFFDSLLFTNYQDLILLRDSITQILTTDQGKVELTFSASKLTTQNSNITISNDWFESVKLFFTEYQTGEGKNLGTYLGKTLIFKKAQDFGTKASVTPKKTNSTESFPCAYSPTATSASFNSAVCRAIILENIVFTPQDPAKDSGKDTEPISQEGTKPKTQPDTQTKLQGISKKILRELLTECNYFEAIKDTDSFLYESIKSKFKFFNPAFHSITPEGLNARLVFLNQCTRPGKTIPTRQDNQEFSNFSDAFNTNFGTPPVLVLRVGDFYNTKIIPDSMTIDFEENSWDMNPEGIGFQPMIATVRLGFKMIGGHGLAEPIEKLQNALSFNYYANTEMYDERADATEVTEAVDKAIVESINNFEPLPNVVNVNNVADFGSPFGVILSASTAVGNTPATAVQDGEIEYTELFNGFVENVKGYINKTTASFVSFINEYNYGVWSQVNHTRIYKTGFVDAYDNLDHQVNILGKQADYQIYLENAAASLIASVYSDEDRLAFALSQTGQLTPQSINKIRSNYISVIANQVITGYTRVAEFVQASSELQLNMVRAMNVMDFISISGDGKTLPDGSLKIYSLSGKTENAVNTHDEFVEDYLTVCSGVTNYYNYGATGGTNNEGFLFITSGLTTGDITTYESLYDTWNRPSDAFVYTFFSKIILDETLRQTFIQQLIKDVSEDVRETAKDFVENICDEWFEDFTLERNEELLLIQQFENKPDYLQFKNFNPTRDGKQLTSKKRVMTFKTGQGDTYLQSLFRDITSSVNYNDSLAVFNGKKQFNG